MLFADDTYLFVSGKDLQELCSGINIELDKLKAWLCINQLSLNSSKINYMIFSNKAMPDVYLNINGTVIERVRVTKFLGVLVLN